MPQPLFHVRATINSLNYFSTKLDKVVEEVIILQGEPNNVYDQYAIKVSNAQLEQVGYIEKSQAQLLNDYLLYMTEIKTQPADVGDFRATCNITITAGTDMKNEILEILINRNVRIPYLDISTGQKFNGYQPLNNNKAKEKKKKQKKNSKK